MIANNIRVNNVAGNINVGADANAAGGNLVGVINVGADAMAGVENWGRYNYNLPIGIFNREFRVSRGGFPRCGLNVEGVDNANVNAAPAA